MESANQSAKTPFRGMMPLMPTAITPSGDLDEASQRRVIDYCLESGAVAIGHFGFASEFHKIGESMRRRLIELIIDHVDGRAPVFLGVTAPANRIMVDYARQAEDMGADMLMVSLPYVNRPDTEGAAALFNQLAEAVTTPIIIQDTGSTSTIFTPEFIARVVRETGRICAVKAEGTDFLTKTVRLMELLGDEVQVIGGAGGKHLIHLLRVGVTAFMTGTEALDIHNAVVRAYLAGDEDGAAHIYFRRLLPYFMFYDDHSDELLKGMLHRRGVLDHPNTIAPAGASVMSDIARREFEWILERIAYGQDAPDGF